MNDFEILDWLEKKVFFLAQRGDEKTPAYELKWLDSSGSIQNVYGISLRHCVKRAANISDRFNE